MALGDIRAADINRAKTYIGPHGTVAHKTGRVSIPATASNGDTIDFAILPRGAQVLDAFLNVLTAPGASVTLALGLAQIPGKSNVQTDADALIAATAAAAAVFLRRNQTGIAASALLLDDDYLLQGVIGGADVTNAFVAECTVFYEFTGTA